MDTETESIIARAERLAAEFEEKARIVNENADSLERESVTEYNVKNQLAQVSRGRSSAEDFRLAAQALRACIKLREEIKENFSCVSPVDDEDECGEIDNCFLHGALQTIDGALTVKE